MESSNRLAPIVLFVYNRLECTKKTMKALEENELAEESELYIFSDGPKFRQDISKVKEVRSYIEETVDRASFKKVTMIKAKKNKGLANSVIDGVSDVIKKYGRVIVLEDDCVTTKDFLRYMNGALDFYEYKASIWSISGYTSSLPALKNYSKDIYLLYRGSSWGWATWKDRWETVDWSVSDYKSFRFSIKKRRKFARGGNDLPSMLKAQMNKKIDSWAIRWCYAQSMQDKLTIYPAVSYLCNVGYENGSHNTPKMEGKYGVILSDGVYSCRFADVAINETLVKESNALWNLTLYSRVAGLIRLKRRSAKERGKHELPSMSKRRKRNIHR